MVVCEVMREARTRRVYFHGGLAFVAGGALGAGTGWLWSTLGLEPLALALSIGVLFGVFFGGLDAYSRVTTKPSLRLIKDYAYACLLGALLFVLVAPVSVIVVSLPLVWWTDISDFEKWSPGAVGAAVGFVAGGLGLASYVQRDREPPA